MTQAMKKLKTMRMTLTKKIDFYTCPLFEWSGTSSCKSLSTKTKPTKEMILFLK